MSTLLSARTSPRSFDQMGPGPFSRLEPKAAELLLGLGALVGAQDEKPLVNQYHRAEVFYLLLHGEVEFCLEVDGQSQGVGRSQRPWTPVGWSGFRDPFRYATSVRVTRYSELLRFRTDQMLRLFEQEPAMATDFFQALAELAAPLLVDVYEGLVGSLHAESKLRHWSATRATEPPSSSSSLREPGVSGAIPLEVGELQGSEAMVTNAAPDPRGLLRRSAFFEHYPDLAVEMLAQEATISYFCRGDAVLTQGGTADELVVLAGGQVRLEYRGSSGKTAALRSYRALGQVLSFCLLDSDRFEPTSVRGMRDGSVIRIGRGALRRLFALYPDWGRLYGQQSLALTGRQLQGARAHLLGEAFDREFLAVDNLIEQCRTQLAVSSELHKLPHLLRSAVTLSDALRLVDTARERGRGIELHVAELCHELLGSVRREQRFFSSLRDAFEQVVYAPPGDSPEKLRRTNAESFIRMFSQIPSRIEGLGHLPERGGNIFIFNHLRNHESNTLPNGFQLTLDSHFISSMVLHRHYGDPGVRVVRQSRAAEYGHQDYYSRLGHVAVYTPESDEPQSDRSERVRNFVETAGGHLLQGTNLVLAPEGTSYATEESPGPFKAGAFRLAASVQPEPLIVPVAVAFFDRRLARSVLGVVIEKPWRLSDRVGDVDDADAMQRFLCQYREEYRALVRRAQQLALDGAG